VRIARGAAAAAAAAAVAIAGSYDWGGKALDLPPVYTLF
jgi:hypothetical protein